MLQKFYTDTLGSRFVKSLLAQTPVPIFDCVDDSVLLVSGQYYFNKDATVKATSSSQSTLCGTIKEFSPQFFETFNSSTNYYDSVTHRQLGKYLRYLKHKSNVNLLPFYNCFAGEYFSDFHLDTSADVVLKSNTQYRIIAVPIKYNYTYTIAVECPTTVMMRPCIHGDLTIKNDTTLETFFGANKRTYAGLQFKHPVVYRIEDPTLSVTPAANQAKQQAIIKAKEDGKSDKEAEEAGASAKEAVLTAAASNQKLALQYKDQLYLAIQVPSSCDSSIVVLENTPTSGIWCNANSVQQFASNLSLLRADTHESYAFSSRLLEYLLGNVVTKDDIYHKNISKVQDALITATNTSGAAYKEQIIQGTYKKGVYDAKIPQLVNELVIANSKSVQILDNNLDINKDIEFLLSAEGGYR